MRLRAGAAAVKVELHHYLLSDFCPRDNGVFVADNHFNYHLHTPPPSPVWTGSISTGPII